MRWNIVLVGRMPITLRGRDRYCYRVAQRSISARCPLPQNLTELTGMMGRQETCQMIGSLYTLTGAVMLHPTSNDSKNIALHTAAMCRFLPVIRDRKLFSSSLIKRNKRLPVVLKVGKELAPFFLLRGVKRAFNGGLYDFQSIGNSFFLQQG